MCENYLSITRNLKIPKQPWNIVSDFQLFTQRLPFTYWFSILQNINFLNGSSIFLLTNNHLLLISEIFFIREIKEGKSILRIRVVLGNTKFNIYVKFFINCLIFLLCFFLVINLCVFLSPHFTPAPFILPLRSVINGGVLLGLLDLIWELLKKRYSEDWAHRTPY